MPRNALIVALALFVIGYGTNVSTPFLVLYRDRLDLGANQTQLIFVVYVVGILATLMIAGQLSDRFGRRRLVIPSLALSAVASLCLIVGRNNYGFLLAGRVLLGVVSGASLGVGAAWMQELMGRGNEMRAAIVTTLVTYGGFGIGPPVSALYEHWGPSPLVAPYLVHIVITLTVIPAVARVAETVDVTGQHGGWRPRIRFGVPTATRRPFVLVMAPVAVLVFGFPSTAFALFPVLVSDAIGGAEVIVAGLAGLLTAWAALLSRPFIARIAPKPALTWGALIGTVGLVIGTVAYASGIWPLVWPAAFLLGSASGILSTACLTLIGEMTDRQNRGALSSTFYVLAYSGMATPLAITAIGGVVGLTTTLVCVTAIAGVVAITTPARRRVAAW